MTYYEYYKQVGIDAFIKEEDWTSAYREIGLAGKAQDLRYTFNHNVLKLAGNMTFYPPFYTEGGDTIPPPSYFSNHYKAFLSQYPLDELYRRFVEGFNERESETKTDTNNVTASTDTTTENSTFKSFPQVAGTELDQDTKIGRNSSTDNSSTTSEDIATGSRELNRSYNTPEATEYFAKFFSDILLKMAKDFVSLTALDGIYYAPDLD